MADLLRRTAHRHPDRPAVIASSGTHSWAELDGAADAGAAALRAAGLDRGERVVIALPTGADLALTIFACARAGLIAVPIGPAHDDTGDVADRVGAMAAIALNRDHGLPIGLDPSDIDRWWARGPVAEPAPARGGGEDLAVLARARGDRAVMLSHRSILAAVEAIGRLDTRRILDGDRVLQVLPMYHVAGWVVAFLPTTLVGGATVIPDVGFDAATLAAGAPEGALRGDPDVVAAGLRAASAALSAAHEHRVTVIAGAPGFYHHLLAVEGAERSLASVRVMTSGTAPLDTDDFTAVHLLTGQPVWEGYGLSESASVVASSLMTPAPRHGSVGRPLSGLELRIVGPDGADVTPGAGPQPQVPADPDDPLDVMAEAPDAGEVGRIAIRGATVFSGYWPDGGGGPGSDGWFVTGDIGFLDDSGELHLVDRAAEVVTVAGFTVYPREVEQVLAAHPEVAEAAVVGVAGRGGDDDVVAVLVAKPDATLTAADLSAFVAERLPAFKRPVLFHIAPSLPRTEVGRLDRGAVRRLYLQTPDATLPRLVAVPTADRPGSGPAVGGAGEPGAVPAGDEARDITPDITPDIAPDITPDITPEQVADLDELGSRLPGTGNRVQRGDQDTDEDLF